MIKDHAITAPDIQDMLRHNLGTRPNGYLGSDYGSDIKSMLQTPQLNGVADSFISKLKKDVPIAAATGVDVYSRNDGVDKKEIVIELSGTGITVAKGDY